MTQVRDVLAQPWKGWGGKVSSNFYGHMGLSENVVYPFLPNGFADHYPYFLWLFHWGYTHDPISHGNHQKITSPSHLMMAKIVGKPGVNLGGWLLLEPGPSYPLFTHHLLKDKSQVRHGTD